jgi:hypothetical protein
MRKTLDLVSLAAVLACMACGGPSVQQSAASAMPTKDTTQLDSPKGPTAPAANPSGGPAPAAPASQPNYGLVTFYLAVGVNGGAAAVLDLIQYVVSLPPTHCSGNSCVWQGSGTADPVTWRLTVSETAGVYTYDLDGAAKSDLTATFKNVVHGTATPSGIPHRGTGAFSLSLDNAYALNPLSTDRGTLAFTYDNSVVGQGKLDVVANHTISKDPADNGAVMNAKYTFKGDGKGGGDLDVGVYNVTTTGSFSLNSQWVAGGAGSAAVSAHVPGALVDPITEAQCWGSAAITISYWNTNDTTDLGANFGAASTCVIQPAPGSNVAATN